MSLRRSPSEYFKSHRRQAPSSPPSSRGGRSLPALLALSVAFVSSACARRGPPTFLKAVPTVPTCTTGTYYCRSTCTVTVCHAVCAECACGLWPVAQQDHGASLPRLPGRSTVPMSMGRLSDVSLSDLDCAVLGTMIMTRTVHVWIMLYRVCVSNSGQRRLLIRMRGPWMAHRVQRLLRAPLPVRRGRGCSLLRHLGCVGIGGHDDRG